MIAQGPDYDVAVIGGSVAGCTAATFLARAGARVALVERRPDPGAFKRVCGHFIQPSGVGVLERLGVMEDLEASRPSRGHGHVWTRAGWLAEGARDELPPALNVRRQVLDPVLRRTAAATRGVDLMAGRTLRSLRREGAGVRIDLRDGGSLTARLVVGADGRGSTTAELAGLPTKRSENLRFGYWGYFEGPWPEPDVGVRLWLLEPDVGIATPTDSGLVVYVAMPHVSRRDEFRHDPEAALRAFVSALPDAPPIGESRRVGPMVGKLDLTNESRPVTGDRVALIGDASLAADPVAAIGCGFALQTAEWLAESLAPAIAGRETLERGLRRYRRTHRRMLRGHALLLADFARREKLPPVQRLLLTAGVHDPRTATRAGAYANRLIRPSQLLTPATLGRAALVALRHRRDAGQPVAAEDRGAVAGAAS